MQRPEDVTAEVRRLLAPNPSPMTERGTNSWLVGRNSVAVIDPGPADAAHVDRIVAACPGGISHIIVTHAHRDHSGGAPLLAARCGAPVLAFGPVGAGRTALMERLAAEGLTGGGEGVDAGFAPDRDVADGEDIVGEGWRLRAHWTPGHFGNHMSLALGRTVFTGDHVMGWATSLVSPPDGDLTQFMDSCRRLLALAPGMLLPGHGAPVADGAGRIREIVAHRQGRTAQIRSALGDRPLTVPALTRAIYTEVAPALLPAAERNVFAHLIALCQQGQAHAEPTISDRAGFRRVG